MEPRYQFNYRKVEHTWDKSKLYIGEATDNNDVLKGILAYDGKEWTMYSTKYLGIPHGVSSNNLLISPGTKLVSDALEETHQVVVVKMVSSLATKFDHELIEYLDQEFDLRDLPTFTFDEMQQYLSDDNQSFPNLTATEYERLKEEIKKLG